MRCSEPALRWPVRTCRIYESHIAFLFSLPAPVAELGSLGHTMSLIDHLAGVSRKKLLSGVIPKLSVARNDVSVAIYDFPYYHHLDHPQERLQDDSYVTAIGREIPMFQCEDGASLHRSLRGFQNCDVVIRVDDHASLRLEFRIDRAGEPYELIAALFSAFDEAFKSAGVTFIKMRE